jgi:hypothetical protein
MSARSREFVLRLLDAKRLEQEANTWKWINIALPIVLIILFSAMGMVWRSKKYSQSTVIL